MVAYFCYHLSDNFVDLSDLYVDLSVIYVELLDHHVDLHVSEKYHNTSLKHFRLVNFIV